MGTAQELPEGVRPSLRGSGGNSFPAELEETAVVIPVVIPGLDFAHCSFSYKLQQPDRFFESQHGSLFFSFLLIFLVKAPYSSEMCM